MLCIQSKNAKLEHGDFKGPHYDFEITIHLLLFSSTTAQCTLVQNETVSFRNYSDVAVAINYHLK